MLDIAIVEDREAEEVRIRKCLNDYEKEKGTLVKIRVFDKGRNLFYEMEESEYRPTVLLLDIQISDMSWIEIARKVRGIDENMHLIFVAHSDRYAKDTIEYSPFRYIIQAELLKELPLALLAIEEKMEWENRNLDFYVVSDTKHPERIRTNDILYVEKDGKNAVIAKRPRRREGITFQGSLFSKTRKSLETMYEELGSDQFAFIDRSVLVNLNHVMGVENDRVFLRDGTVLQACPIRMKELKEKIREMWKVYA